MRKIAEEKPKMVSHKNNPTRTKQELPSTPNLFKSNGDHKQKKKTHVGFCFD